MLLSDTTRRTDHQTPVETVAPPCSNRSLKRLNDNSIKIKEPAFSPYDKLRAEMDALNTTHTIAVAPQKPCSLARRTWAFIVDMGITSGIISGLFILLIVPIGILSAVYFRKLSDLLSMDPMLSIALMATVFLFALLICLSSLHLYFIFLEHNWNGQTFGKKMFGVKVISLDGNPLTWKQCVQREVYRYVDHLLLFPVFIAIRNSPLGQRIGDRVANTMVIHLSAEENAADSLFFPNDLYEKLVSYMKPDPLPLSFEKDFLAWAFPVFITQTKKVLHEEMALKVQSLQPYLHLDSLSAEHSSMSIEMILRFFAEYCRRQLAQKERSKFYGGV